MDRLRCGAQQLVVREVLRAASLSTVAALAVACTVPPVTAADASGTTHGDSEFDGGASADETSDDGASGQTPTDSTGQPTLCGNGAIDLDEDCDDGNADSGDGCSAECSFESGTVLARWDAPRDAQIAVDGHGNVAAVNSAHVVLGWTLDGEQLDTFVVPHSDATQLVLHRIATASDGDLVIAGIECDHECSSPTGTLGDRFIARITADREVRWTLIIEGSHRSTPRLVPLADGGIAVVDPGLADFSTAIYVYTAEGDREWLGDHGFGRATLAVRPDGNFMFMSDTELVRVIDRHDGSVLDEWSLDAFNPVPGVLAIDDAGTAVVVSQGFEPMNNHGVMHAVDHTGRPLWSSPPISTYLLETSLFSPPLVVLPGDRMALGGGTLQDSASSSLAILDTTTGETTASALGLFDGPELIGDLAVDPRGHLLCVLTTYELGGPPQLVRLVP